MNLTQPFREMVERSSMAVSDTLDMITAKINAVWNIQHTADGGHTDITADSVTVGGDVTSGGSGTFAGNVTAQDATVPVVIGSHALTGSVRPVVGMDATGSTTNHWRVGPYPLSGGSQRRELLVSDVIGGSLYTLRLFWDAVSSQYVLAPDTANPFNLGLEEIGRAHV